MRYCDGGSTPSCISSQNAINLKFLRVWNSGKNNKITYRGIPVCTRGRVIYSSSVFILSGKSILNVNPTDNNIDMPSCFLPRLNFQFRWRVTTPETREDSRSAVAVRIWNSCAEFPHIRFERETTGPSHSFAF